MLKSNCLLLRLWFPNLKKKVASECAFNCLNALPSRFRCCELCPLCKQWYVNISLDIKRDIAFILTASFYDSAQWCVCVFKIKYKKSKSSKTKEDSAVSACVWRLLLFSQLFRLHWVFFFSKPMCHLTESKSPLSNKSSLIGSYIADV